MVVGWGLINGRLKRVGKDIHPGIINQVNLWAWMM